MQLSTYINYINFTEMFVLVVSLFAKNMPANGMEWIIHYAFIYEIYVIYNHIFCQVFYVQHRNTTYYIIILQKVMQTYNKCIS